MGRPGEGGGWHAAAAPPQPASRQAAGHPRGRPVTVRVGVPCEAEAGCGAPHVAARPRRQANPNAVATVRFACASAFSQRIPVAPADGRRPPPERGAAEATSVEVAEW